MITQAIGTALEEGVDLLTRDKTVQEAGHNLFMSIIFGAAGSNVNIKHPINFISNNKLMKMIRKQFGSLSAEEAKQWSQFIKKTKKHIKDDVNQLANAPVETGVATLKKVVSIENEEERSDEKQ